MSITMEYEEELSTEPDDPFQFWFVAIKHIKVNDYIIDLKKYLKTNAKYIVAQETKKNVHKETNGEHIHVAATMSEENFKRFHQNIHQKKLKLQLRAGNGVGKQAGRVKDVKDQVKMLAYTCKDKNLQTQNMTKQEIEELIEKSYPKADTWEDQIMQNIHLHLQMPFAPIDYCNIDAVSMDIETLIIDHYLQHSKQKAVPSRAYIKKLMLRFLMYEIDEKIPAKVIRQLI